MKTFASQLRAARALLDVDQEVVAAWVGLDRREVSGWERAKYKLLSSDGENLRKEFEAREIEFVAASDVHGAGVRWRKPGHQDRHRGAQFRAARALADLSMREIEDACGINRNFLTRLESAKLGALNLGYIRTLEAFFKKRNVELIPEDLTSGAGARWTVAQAFE